ncbi:MAG: tetratricopeptide repeat protein [Candidatus Margulisbacteria bacterium]|nr:tetratricopeptide repeat protein [Candidatus Margulisiibacteriota bacterium]
MYIFAEETSVENVLNINFPLRRKIFVLYRISLYKQERYEEALSCYEKALKVDSRDKFIWNNKGLVLYNLKRYEESLACFDRAINLDSDYKYAWSNKGLTLYKRGRYDESADCYDKLLEKDLDFFDATEKRDEALQMIKE